MRGLIFLPPNYKLSQPMRVAQLRRPLGFSVHRHCSLSNVLEKLSTPIFLRRSSSVFTNLQFRTLNGPPALAMASDDLSALTNSDVEKYGFRRPEMHQSNLAGTLEGYDRHVFLCYKSPAAWAPRVENSDSDILPKMLASAVKARKNDFASKTMLTICEGGDTPELSDADVLIFPDMIKYKSLKEEDVESFVDDVLVNGKPWASGVQEVITGSYVFVCAHASRDKRCGVCGPVLIEKFKEEVDLRGMKDHVLISPCSHIGGHKYAGNLIIFSPGPDGKIMGNWYGYVTPEDVPALIDQHIAKGEIIERLWRGQMGVHDLAKADKTEKHKVPNGAEVRRSKKKSSEKESAKENVNGCCQGVGANGFSCCKEEKNDATTSKKPSKLSCWMGMQEQSDILTAAAVIGAVVTVAVAYSLYRSGGMI